MPRVISSSITVFYKFVFPTIWLAPFAIGTCGLYINAVMNTNAQARGQSQLLCIPFTMALLVGGACFYELFKRLNKVAIDRDHLLVCNYFSEFVVPLSDIESVTEIVWINIHPVTISFKTETPFGKKIVFMPKMRLFGAFQTHPVVAEQRELAAQPKPLGLESSRAA